jgi:hypothetical protein
MESIVLAIKFVLFYGLETIVLALVGAALAAELYHRAGRKPRAVRKDSYPRMTMPDEKIVMWVEEQKLELSVESWLRGH